MIEPIERYLNQLRRALDRFSIDAAAQIAETLLDARRRNARVFVFGNGGSASTASHWACDLAKGTLDESRNGGQKPLRVVSLTDNQALITAWANDLSYDDIFAKQIENLADEGDVAVAVSASGESENVLRGVAAAKRIGCATIAAAGFGGGTLARICDIAFVAESGDYGVVEDLHLTLNHILRLVIHEAILAEGGNGTD